MRLKQIPSDFKVTEAIKIPKKDSSRKYTYFWLEKTNYTTTRAMQQISRVLRISKRRLHFSGTKDKNAVTKQLVSVMHISPEKLKTLKLKDIKIKPLHRGKERVCLGMHSANKFEIIVRDLGENLRSGELKTAPKHVYSQNRQAIELVRLQLEKGYPNYFDEQRFSSNNADVGKALVRGFVREAVELILAKDKTSEKLAKEQKWKELANYYDKPHSAERTIASWLITHKNDYAGAFRNLHKKVRMLYIHAYQSSLFNKALSSTIKKAFSHIEIANEKLAIGKVKGEEKSLPGYKTKLTSSVYDQEIAKSLRADQVSLEDFKMKRTPELASPGTVRQASVKANKLKLGALRKDELNFGKKKVKVSFELPKGAYATLLVKILFS